MARHSRIAIFFLAAAASASSAQQPSPVPQAGEAPVPATEGFFRPASDPSLTRFLTPPENQAARRATPGVVEAVEALESERRAREAAERELDRVHREQVQRQAATPAARPMIVSPLDGTAPIVSTLDGTAPVITPLGR